MKKIVSLLLVFIVCISSFPLLAFAQDGPGEYTDTETETIYSRYVYNESMLDAIFGDDTAVGYWNVVNDTEEKGFLKWLIDASSWIIGEYPDKQDYAEILANLIMMQSGDLAEQVQNQSQYDDLKDGMDYAIDIVDIASDFVGGANLLEEISPIIDAATGGADVIIDNIEQAKYYEITIRDYTQSKLFLDAISNYAENEELRATASTLLEANDKLLESRLEYLADSSATLADYQAEFFVKNMSFGLLKTADLYKADETVKWYVDGGEKISKSIQSIFSGANFAFRMTMLAGDIGFGTSDTFNRYQEMKTVSDIAGAIVEANHHVQTPSRYDSPDALNIIQTKCNYYKMLIATHARGEYLVYQLLINDAGLLSDFRALFDAFKDPGETTESWYNGQINVMLEYFDILNNMFVIEEENKTTTDLGDVPQDAAEFNGHYYYVYDIDTVATWEDAKEYCESQGGYLATITSQEEDEFLYSYITDMGYNSVLFGLSDTDQDNVWTWVTGEPFSYENWASGEPNRQGGYEHYGMYYEKNKNGTWNDGSGKTCPFLCEWGEYQAVESSYDDYNLAQSSSQQQLHDTLIKYISGDLNVRELPQHDSKLVGKIDDFYTKLYFYGETKEGVGSDGEKHTWYKIRSDSNINGWVRSDFVISQDANVMYPYASDNEGADCWKYTDRVLDVRSEPTYNSKLVGEVTDCNTYIHCCYTGLGLVKGVDSDGQLYEWTKVVVNSELQGWVRNDLLVEVSSPAWVDDIFIKNSSVPLNVRAQPQHDSELITSIENADTKMYYWGVSEWGLGSDGIMHEWYQVDVSSTERGWVRSDLIKSVLY